jgi:hypothetical protein
MYAQQQERQRRQQEQRQQYYGAIAYSQSTGNLGWSWGQEDRAAAERAALAKCSASDAAIVIYGSNCYLHLRSERTGEAGDGTKINKPQSGMRGRSVVNPHISKW